MSSGRLQTHGRSALPVGTHGLIWVVDLGPGKPKGRYEAICNYRDSDGSTSRVSRRGRSKTEARTRLQEALRQRSSSRGSSALAPSSKYSKLLTLYLAQLDAQVETGQLSPTTRGTYQHWLTKYIAPRLGQLRLQEINVAVLENFLAELAVGASSKRTVRAVLRATLQIGLRHQAISTNPARELERIRSTSAKRPPRALTADERADLLAKLRTDPYARRCDLPALVTFMLGTGVRIGEALAVRWCDLDLGGMVIGGARVPVVRITGNLVWVRGQGLVRRSGKTQAAMRTIALPRFVIDILSERRPRWTTNDEGPVFPAEKVDGWRWPSNVQRAWRGARKRARYEWVTPHVFRKTASTALEEMGLTVRQRGDVLGHANLTTTQDVYTHRGDVHPAAAVALDTAFGAAVAGR